jgi:ornithine lipid hydroxylase
MAAVFRLVAHPALLLGVVGAAAGLLAAGHEPALVVAALAVVGAVAIALLERASPHRGEWQRSHGDVRTDLLHMVFGMIPVPVIFRAAFLGVLTAASIELASLAGGSPWPSAWPWPAQLALALVVGELGQYWIHRLAHERPALWRLHAVHHSVERLYWLNAGRFHPLDTLLQHGAEMAPLILLGAPPPVIALYTVFTSANGMLRHCNIELRTTGLDWVLSTAELHRWHHSVVVDESNANYGANLILWDVVFRTRKKPRDASPPTLGLPMKDFPRTFLAQLAAPVRWRW